MTSRAPAQAHIALFVALLVIPAGAFSPGSVVASLEPSTPKNIRCAALMRERPSALVRDDFHMIPGLLKADLNDTSITRWCKLSPSLRQPDRCQPAPACRRSRASTGGAPDIGWPWALVVIEHANLRAQRTEQKNTVSRAPVPPSGRSERLHREIRISRTTPMRRTRGRRTVGSRSYAPVIADTYLPSHTWSPYVWSLLLVPQSVPVQFGGEHRLSRQFSSATLYRGSFDSAKTLGSSRISFISGSIVTQFGVLFQSWNQDRPRILGDWSGLVDPAQ